MDTRKIPPFVTLTAGLVAAVMTFVGHYELKDSLVIILGVLVGFYIFSLLIKLLFDKMGISDIALKKKEREEKEKALLEEYEASKKQDEQDNAMMESEDGSVIEKERES